MGENGFSIIRDGSFTVSGAAAEKLIASKNPTAALLYIYIMSRGEMVSASNAAAVLGKSEQDISAAFSCLASLGLIGSAPDAVQVKKAAADEMPQYTAQDVKNEMREGSVFPQLATEAERILGRILSSDDLRKLLGMYDYLALPPEVIVLLITYCRDEVISRYKGQRSVSMRYIEKVAFSWEKDGICTLELAESYIKNRTEIRNLSDGIRDIIGIRDRALTATEQKYVDAWAQLNLPRDVIELAYDRTVVNTGKLTWKYMDTILRSWSANGIKTAAQANGEMKKPAAPKSAQSTAPAKVTREDLERRRRLIREMNGQ